MNNPYIQALVLLALTVFFCQESAAGEFSLEGQGVEARSESWIVAASVSESWHSVNTKVRYIKGRTDGETVSDFAEITLDSGLRVSRSWSLWADERVHKDSVVGVIDNRFGAGPKYTFLNLANTKASASIGVLHHWRKWSTGAQEAQARASLRLKGQTGEEVVLTSVMFYQPSLEDNSDYLASLDIRLAMKLNEHTSAILSFENKYQSMAEPKDRNQTLWLVGISTSWGQDEDGEI